jgi:hypothetical protein
MNLLCKAYSDYGEAKSVYFLLQAKPQALKRLRELVEFIGSLKERYPEIMSLKCAIKGLGFFVESPGLIHELESALKNPNLEEDLERSWASSWVELPETFEIKLGYDELPLGTIDVGGGNGIVVSEEGVYIVDFETGTLARFEARHLDYEFIRRLADQAQPDSRKGVKPRRAKP